MLIEVYSHTDLVNIAREWLRKTRKCSVVVGEISAMGCEDPDAIGWYGSVTHLVECKTSRSDFLADKKKLPRRFAQVGMGDFRWYLALPGVVKDAAELPYRWGLIEIRNGRPIVVLPAEQQAEKHHQYEACVLLSVIKRIGQTAPTGCSIRAFTHKTNNRTSVDIDLETQPLSSEPCEVTETTT